MFTTDWNDGFKEKCTGAKTASDSRWIEGSHKGEMYLELLFYFIHIYANSLISDQFKH